MLEKLRKSASGIIAKILIGLLIISFAVWGIGDMVRSYGRDVVASVGGTTISAGEFRRAYQLQIDAVSRQFGRRLTPQEAKAFGIEQQVIARLTGSAAVDNHGQSLNLALSDKAIIENVYRDPLFQGPSGNFSEPRLVEILRQGGYSEGQFFEARKRDVLRSQITDSMLSGVEPPKAMIDMLRTYQTEERVAEFIEVTADKAVKLDTPTTEELKKTYEANKHRFVVPEYRKFQALLLTSEAAKSKLDITEADLRMIYENEKAGFQVPEQRRIQQIAFKDKAAAEAAKAELSSGKTFEEVAKASGAQETDINLGLLTKNALIDPAIAEAAFALKKDEVSTVVDGRFAPVLLRVTEINEGRQRTFDEVKGDIRQRIESERVAEKIQEIQNNIDDNRLAGKSIREISEILDLPFLDIAAIDREGNTPEGKPAITSNDKDQLVSTAFAAEVGVENEVIRLSNDGLAWVNLIAVTPEKQRPFDEVAEDVKRVWQEIETAEKLREATSEIAKRVNAGATLAEIANELGAKVKSTPAFKRGDSVPDIPPAAISRVFAMSEGAAADAASGTDNTRLVLKVTKVLPPKEATASALDNLKQQTVRQLQSDVVAQYVTELQKDMAVSVNQTVVDLTTGASADLN